MAEALTHTPRSRLAVAKVLYLLAVTAAAFTVPAVEATAPARWYVVPGLFLLQVLTLFACRVAPAEIFRPAWRLKWLFVFLLVCYALLPSEDAAPNEDLRFWRIPGFESLVAVNVVGLERAGMMCLQILTVILASAVVRHTGSGMDFVDGLRSFGLPRLFVHSLDETLSLLAGPNRERPNQTAPVHSPGLLALLARLLRGDLAPFAHSIRANLDDASRRAAHVTNGQPNPRLAHDVSVISAVALAMVSLKIIKVLPGVPFAPGFKTLFLFPLYVVASEFAYSRWGATVAGAIMGVIGFLQGDGRYGFLEILKHVAPGLVIDLVRPVVRRLPPSAIVYCLLGFLAAIARTSTELAIVLLLGARAEVYLFPAAKLIPNLVAGTLSGLVTLFVLRALRQAKRAGESPADHASTATKEPEGAAIVKSLPPPLTVAVDLTRETQ